MWRLLSDLLRSFFFPPRKDYPYPANYEFYLPEAYSPVRATHLIRDLMAALDISLTEVEIIFQLRSNGDSLDEDTLLAVIDHVQDAHLRKTLRYLVRDGYLTREIDEFEMVRYRLTEAVTSHLE